ncbi:MAG: flagellar biosynthetic protein FliR [Rickettsiaceae bacterium]|nr:flagellar biosynthetic protein FliR [Rickettsiaceae bacterium]
MLAELTTEYIFHFTLLFARLGTAFGNFPALSTNYIFMRAKVAFALIVTVILLPIVSPYLPKYSDSISMNMSYLMLEVLIGLIISIAAKLYFLSLNFVGQILAMQSGLAAATFFDPNQRSQVALFSNFLMIITIVFIFASNTHYLYLQAITDSYQKFPPGELLNSADISNFVSYVVNDSFILSFKLVSPFLIINLAILTASGMLARLMPNLQVFFVVTPGQMLVMFTTMYIVINAIISKLVAQIGISVNVLGF